MKMKKTFIALVAALITASSTISCIREEAPNAEADILSCEVDGNLLIRRPVITNDEIKLYINGWDDVSHVSPRFALTPGATIAPASGTVRDFSHPQTYTVTSQDQQWKKTYTVRFVADDAATEYHFDNARYHEFGNKRFFHIFYDTTADGAEMTWGSGNAGFMILNNSAPAEDYPTSQSEDGYRGRCAKLVTRSTGSYGAMMKAPIAAGNLFTGTFSINLGNMAKSTHFGIPFRKKPKALLGYYKYKAGETVTDQNLTPQPLLKDTCDIYAVFYETTSDVPHLDGTNIKTHPNIVMIAQLKDRKQTDVWTPFFIPFETVNGRQIDEQKLRNGIYNLAIVLSSSQGGAQFIGAVGSTLYVDEMQLYYE